LKRSSGTIKIPLWVFKHYFSEKVSFSCDCKLN